MTKKTSGNNKYKKETHSKDIKTTEGNKNSLVMKILVFLGVVIFCFILLYLMYHFFVKESDIKINMSTDKQIEYITLYDEEELIITQKYVSDLSYTMRYDVNSFKVFKYKEQDIYRNLNNERMLVVVEKATLPSNCSTTTLNNEYNNCYIKIDDYTEEYYVSSSNQTYKITIKTPGTSDYTIDIKTRVDNMLKSFSITI